MQYLLSVIDDTADLATPDETAVAGDPILYPACLTRSTTGS